MNWGKIFRIFVLATLNVIFSVVNNVTFWQAANKMPDYQGWLAIIATIPLLPCYWALYLIDVKFPGILSSSSNKTK